MAKFRTIVAASTFLGAIALGSGLVAQQGTGGRADRGPGVDPSIRSLIEARIGVAREIFESAMAPPQDGPLDDLPSWSRRWMDDEIGLNPDSGPASRLAAIRAHLGRIKSLEEIAARRQDAARGARADVLKLKYFRLEAEQMLAELRIINPGLFPPTPPARP
ncbi:hypothetical protein TA3x_005512 [Tundrisphaera sp. TA3]|uniref:hypothetical protein n=1 Tax=Tundrisphaera sp. TA3 TaxID=3435775 RepID=UPI003EB87A96